MKKSKTKNGSWLIIILPIFLSLIMTTYTLDRQLIIRFLALGIILFAGALFSFIKHDHSNIDFNIKVITFFTTLFAFILLGGLSLFHTINPSDGLFIFAKILLFTSLILSIYLFINEPEMLINYLCKSIVILSLSVCTIGFYQVYKILVSTGLSHSNLYNVTVTFGHKNLFIEYIFLLLPFNVYCIFHKTKIWKALGIIATVSIIIAIIIFMTRSVWVAVVVSIFGTSLIGLATKSLYFTHLRKYIIQVFMVILIVLAVVFTYSKFDRSSAFAKQLTKITNFQYGTVKDRLILWKNSLTIFQEAPILGKGLGSWKIHILNCGNQDLKSANNLIFYQRPHNDFIWILCEMGILGLASYLFLFFYAFYIIYKQLKSKPTNSIQQFIFALTFALIGFMTVSFFSFPFDRMEHLIFLAIIMGSLLIIEKHSTVQNPKNVNFKYLSIILILLTLFPIIIGSIRFISEIHFKKAYDYRSTRQWDLMISEIDYAYNRFYQIDPYSTPLPWYKGLYFLNFKTAEEALPNLYHAYEINPYHIYVLNDLAACYSKLNKTEHSIEFFKRAIQISPNFEESLYNLTALYSQLNQPDSAFHYFNRITDSKSPAKYDLYLDVILKPRIINLLKTISDDDVHKVVIEIMNTHQWTKDILKKSNINAISFENQLLLDAIFILKTENKITLQKEENLKLKYKL